MRILKLSTTVLSFGLVLAASGSSAQTAKDLIGAWLTVSVAVDQGDKKIEPFGPNAKGTQIYDASGRFATIVMRGDLPKVASNNMLAPMFFLGWPLVPRKGTTVHFKRDH